MITPKIFLKNKYPLVIVDMDIHSATDILKYDHFDAKLWPKNLEKVLKCDILYFSVTEIGSEFW